MSISRNYNRQVIAFALQSIALANFSDGAVQQAVQLPAGAIVTRAFLVVDEVFNAATTATAKVGDSADDDRYSATPVDLKTMGKKDLDITGYEMPAQGFLTVTYASTGAVATTGKARLFVEYIDTGKADWTQG
ncbi:hypothetical protein [Pseudomonas sp. USHLN015]|uniref:hypothetical protein n=1 Tax=Pseudomonas sp. USHLN015 TaxID=3081296 RepID=UPI00301CE217